MSITLQRRYTLLSMTTADFHVKGAICKQDRGYGDEETDRPATGSAEASQSETSALKTTNEYK